MEEEKMGYEEMKDLMEKIAKEIDRTRQRQEKIDTLTEEWRNEVRPVVVKEKEEELENAKKEKAEFDEMTKNALMNVGKGIVTLREESEKEFNKKLMEITTKENHMKRHLLERDPSPAIADKILKIEESARRNRSKLKEEQAKLREELKDQEGLVWEYADEIGVAEELQKEGLDRPLRPEQKVEEQPEPTPQQKKEDPEPTPQQKEEETKQTPQQQEEEAKQKSSTNQKRTENDLSQKATPTSKSNSSKAKTQTKKTTRTMPKEEVPKKYREEGFSQNADGEYFNPWKDEYDPDYDPSKDPTYNPRLDENKADTKGKEEQESSSYAQRLAEYKKLLAEYKAKLGEFYHSEGQYKEDKIDYAKYSENAKTMLDEYATIKSEYDKIYDLYQKEMAKMQDPYQNLTNEDLANKLGELEEQLAEEWNYSVHKENGMESNERIDEIQEQISKLKKELKDREENLYRGLTDEELKQKQNELYGKIIPDEGEYHFRAHQENGLEGYEEDEIDAELKKIREEIERRKPKTIEEPEMPEEPRVIPEKGKELPGEETPRTFEEILYKIQAAKNAMSDAELGRYDTAKGKWLVPVKYDKGDWLRNSARAIVKRVFGSMINVPRKIYSKIRTGKKQEEKYTNMINHVNDLSEQDFKTLLDGLQSYKGQENKVSASLRRAVQLRAQKEVSKQNAQRNEDIYKAFDEIEKTHAESKQIAEKLKGELTEEERTSLINRKLQIDTRNAQLVRNIETMRAEGAKAQGGIGLHGLEEESKAAREGANLAGRKFAKRFSNDEELEKRQALLQQAQRIARAKGDGFREVEAFLAHEKLLEENTSTRKIMGINVSRSARSHAKGVITKSYERDDLVTNIVTIAALTATTVNMIKQIQNQAAIAAKNNEIAGANAQNAKMAETGNDLRQRVASQDGVVERGIEGTNATRDASAFGIGHTHAGTASNWTNQWGSSQLDQEFHKIMSGTITDDTLKTFINSGKGTIEAYAKTHPYEYGPLLRAMEQLGNGGVEAITEYNTAMRNLVQFAKDMGEIQSTSVSAIGLSPTYIETMLPLLMAGKAITSKEYEKLSNKIKKKEKKKETRDKRKDKDDEKDFKKKLSEQVKQIQEDKKQKKENTKENEPEQSSEKKEVAEDASR